MRFTTAGIKAVLAPATSHAVSTAEVAPSFIRLLITATATGGKSAGATRPDVSANSTSRDATATTLKSTPAHSMPR